MPQPQPTPLPANVAAALDAYALTQSDLPPGYAVAGKVQLPNDQAATGYADQQQALQRIQATGRVGGIAQQVLPPSAGVGQIGVSIDAFKDANGAHDWVSNPPAYPPSLKVEPAKLPQQLGEQSTAIHWTQNGSGGYVINFRRGRIVFGLGLSAPVGKESLDPLLQIAHALDVKAMKQAS